MKEIEVFGKSRVRLIEGRVEQLRLMESSARRARWFPEVWGRAVGLAVALGESSVSESTWRRAWREVNGVDLVESGA